jgi:hypothetical protein
MFDYYQHTFLLKGTEFPVVVVDKGDLRADNKKPANNFALKNI